MPPPLDPSGFQIAVNVVVAGSGRRVSLWMGGARGLDPDRGFDLATVETRGGLDDLPVVESVEITMARSLVSQVTINVAAPFESGIRLLEGDLFRIGNMYEVQLGYPRLGRFLPWISAIAIKPSLTISPDEGLTATLNGSGGGFAALRGSFSTSYTGSFRSILTEIAQQPWNNWELDFPEQQANDPFDEDRGMISQGNRSEWFFLQQIVRTANCDAYLRPSTSEQGKFALVVRRRQESFEADPRLTFIMRGRVDFQSFFPLFDFSSEAEGVWLPRAGVGTVSNDIDPDTGEVVAAEGGPQTSAVPATEQTQAGAGTATVGSGQSALHPDQDSDEVTGERMTVSSRDPRTPTQVVQSRFEEARIQGAINATASSFGIPELFPGDLVRLLGLGIFEGRYMIDSMTHRAGPGEWTMEMRLLSNALQTGALAEHLQVTPTAINTREPAELSDGSDDATSGATIPVDATPEEAVAFATGGT